MKTIKKTEKKASLKKKKNPGAKRQKAKSGDSVNPSGQRLQNSFIDDNEDEFEVPLDELESFDTFNDYDEEDDF